MIQQLLTRPGGTPPQAMAGRYCRSSQRNTWETPAASVPRRTILIGNAATRLRQLPPDSIDCCVTSPPYYLLRDYGTVEQLGLETDVDQWVEQLRGVVAEIARVLKATGSLWLNLGDSFSRAERYGAPAKSLLLAPERLLLALVVDGWIVRNKVIWAKPNPMPHSVRDRLNTTYEVVYFLVRSRSYYFSLDEIREPHRSTRQPAPSRPSKYTSGGRAWAGPLAGSNGGLARVRADGRAGHVLGGNPGDVWRLATGGYRGAHFATFPERLITRPIVAGCPERVCQACGAPWRRDVASDIVGEREAAGTDAWVRRYPSRWLVVRQLGDLTPGCRCQADCLPGVVLDPFFGAGTVGVVAEQHGRDWIGIELNPTYATLAQERIEAARVRQQRAA